MTAAIPDDILVAARKAISEHVSEPARHQYLEGKHDHFAIIRALCCALQAERKRCARVAENFDWVLEVYEAAEMNEATGRAACEVQEQIARAIRNPAGE